MEKLQDLLTYLRTHGNPERAVTVEEMEEILSAIINAMNEKRF